MLNLNIKKITGIIAGTAGFLVLSMTVLANPGPNITVQSLPISDASGGITYQIRVTNTGDQTANDVFIRSILDTREKFVSTSPVPDTSSTNNSTMTLIWHTPDIKPGAEYSITLNTLINSTAQVGSIIKNNISVYGNNFATQNGSTTVLVGPITGQGGSTGSSLPVTGVDPILLLAIIAPAGLAIMLWFCLMWAKRE